MPPYAYPQGNACLKRTLNLQRPSRVSSPSSPTSGAHPPTPPLLCPGRDDERELSAAKSCLPALCQQRTPRGASLRRRTPWTRRCRPPLPVRPLPPCARRATLKHSTRRRRCPASARDPDLLPPRRVLLLLPLVLLPRQAPPQQVNDLPPAAPGPRAVHARSPDDGRDQAAGPARRDGRGRGQGGAAAARRRGRVVEGERGAGRGLARGQGRGRGQRTGRDGVSDQRGCRPWCARFPPSLSQLSRGTQSSPPQHKIAQASPSTITSSSLAKGSSSSLAATSTRQRCSSFCRTSRRTSSEAPVPSLP